MIRKHPRLHLALTAGRLAGRRLLGRAVDDQDLALGASLTGHLDEMKGLAMKVGQIVSYLDVPLPEEVQDQLAQLQTGQAGMSIDVVRPIVESALEGPLESRFERFDPVPVAAASIGQVHRARVAGRDVAVKVQYPTVAGSFEADLGSLRRVASLASVASAVDGRAIVDELAARLEEECDYAREARMQQAFGRAFAHEPSVVVPGVVTSHCAGPVLTTDWIEGAGFATLCAAGDARRNAAAATTLVRFTYRSLLSMGTIQADPHPGNFVFLRDGRVAFLDFGCVRALRADFVDGLRALTRAVLYDDRARFREAVHALGLVGDERRFDYDHFFSVMSHLHRPFLTTRFTFTRAYVREGHALNGPSSPNARSLAIPPEYVWVARLQWGLWSILARLGATGSFAPLLEEVLAVRPSAPSSDVIASTGMS